MNRELLIVPDQHLRSFWRPILNSDLPVCFLGDYIDPYQHEGITYDSGIQEFKDIIEFAKQEPDRVTLLLGNHDCAYCGMSDTLARFDYQHSEEIYAMFKENEQLFRLAFRWGDCLLTHAGVSRKWLSQNKLEENPDTIVDLLNSYINFNDHWIKNPDWFYAKYNGPIGDVGRSRGGTAPIGSPIWCDLSEIFYSPAFEDSLQMVIGHTQLQKTGNIVHNKNCWFCDSRAIFIWNGEELKLWK